MSIRDKVKGSGGKVDLEGPRELVRVQKQVADGQGEIAQKAASAAVAVTMGFTAAAASVTNAFKGAALNKADWKKAEKLMNAGPSSSPADALAKMQGTDAGKAATADATLAASSRALLGSSTELGKAAAALQQFAAGHPVASTVGATAAGTLLSGAGAGAIKGAATGAKSLLGGAASAGVGGLAVGAMIGGYLDENDTFGQQAGRDKKLAAASKNTSVWQEAAKTKREVVAHGGSQVDAKAIADAIVAGLAKAKINAMITNATGGPIEVANNQASSGAAGSQGAGR